mmetsp:Transcript_67235/g.77996  ORF Transcript_67235/g.77996 Transcript_67235/m.77996 type:complete len:101 (+) Transcript_67235:34-336(+)
MNNDIEVKLSQEFGIVVLLVMSNFANNTSGTVNNMSSYSNFFKAESFNFVATTKMMGDITNNTSNFSDTISNFANFIPINMNVFDFATVLARLKWGGEIL